MRSAAVIPFWMKRTPPRAFSKTDFRDPKIYPNPEAGYDCVVGNRTGDGTLFLIGNYDAETHHFERERVQAMDYGLDFYAPQTADGISFQCQGKALMSVEKYDIVMNQ